MSADMKPEFKTDLVYVVCFTVSEYKR